MTKINSIKTSNGSVHKIDGALGFPSSKKIKLDFPSPESINSVTYTAPANGWVMFHGVASEGASTASYLSLTREDGLIVSYTFIGHNCSISTPLLPVLKGQKFTAYDTRCIYTREYDGVFFFYNVDSESEGD